MPAEFDQTTAKLLNLLQSDFPLVKQPFAVIGQRLGLDEADVLKRVTQLKSSVIRQIGAIFDSRALGYESCLVAARVSTDRIHQAAAEINRHPGVSHNYARDHAYNLWYTVAVPPHSRLGLAGTVMSLHELSGATVTRLLPALRLYKIGVKFDVTGANDATATNEQDGIGEVPARIDVTDGDKSMIRVLQQDLPMGSRPFDEWAADARCTADELLAAAQRYLDYGVMRRFSAVIRHRAAGFGANAMGAWIVPPDQQDQFGAVAASFAAVSHCYLRPTYEDWPYSIFTMVHGKSPAQCEEALAAISGRTGVTDYAALYSTHEYKKVRVRYFTGDTEAWEAQAWNRAAQCTT
jgi:DNA-binding Lrp family transcriptional regulator